MSEHDSFIEYYRKMRIHLTEELKHRIAQASRQMPNRDLAKLLGISKATVYEIRCDHDGDLSPLPVTNRTTFSEMIVQLAGDIAATAHEAAPGRPQWVRDLIIRTRQLRERRTTH